MRSSIASGFVRSCASAALAAAAIATPFATLAQPAAAPADKPSAPAASTAPVESPDARAASDAAKKATELLKAGKADEALAELEAGLKAAPRDAQLRFLYGVTIANKGRTRDAIDVFQQLTEDFPELPEPYNNLAVMHAANGDLDRARDALENAVRALPGYSLALENLGDVYLRMAARSWERALAVDSKNEAARTRLSLAREMLARIAPPAAASPASSAPAGASPGPAPGTSSAAPAGGAASAAPAPAAR